jgi:hypothetical protein
MTSTSTSFAATFASIADVDGWMTEGQARRLWDRASALRPGARVVEIGSYHGRSAIVLATAAPEGVEVVAIDPHAGNDRGPQQIVGPPRRASATTRRSSPTWSGRACAIGCATSARRRRAAGPRSRAGSACSTSTGPTAMRRSQRHRRVG